MNKNILIADDSMITRLRVKGLLTELGNFNIIEAQNGQEVLDKIENENFNLLILDLLMPNITGFDVLEEIKNKKVNIPTIIFSADIQDTTKEKCLNLGAIGFAPKTQDLSVLKELINKTL